MKKFNDNFFTEDNFILTTTTYDYLPVNRENRETYHICYNVNDGFIHIMGASMISVLENNKDKYFIFYIFTDGYSETNSKKLEELAKQWKCRCILYHLDMNPFEDFHIKVARFSRITYARIFAPKVIGQYTDKYIYLDADTMCAKSLASLWETDMQNAAMGAVSEGADVVAYRGQYLHLKNGKYFNDGIMLINIPKWKEQKITEKAFAYQNEPPKRFLGQSQDVLNLTFDGTNYFLSPEYNAFRGGADFEIDKCTIVHWTGRRKPWQMVLTPYDEMWREYNRLSPWETLTNILPVKKPENYHDFQQWGDYEKSKGNYAKYLQGLFWYSILRIRYKLAGNKKD